MVASYTDDVVDVPKISRMPPLIFMELFLFAVYYHFELGRWALLCTHGWAAFYSVIGIQLAKKPEWNRKIDGYPIWSFILSELNQFIAIPLLGICALSIAPDTLTFLESRLRDDDSYSFHIFYSIAGCMTKDVWITKEHDVTAISLGLAFHHCLTVFGCGVSLSLARGTGYAVAVAIVAEVGSGFYVLHALYQNATSFVTYVVLMVLSNICGVYFGIELFAFPNPHFYGEIYAVLMFLIILIRQIGWFMAIHEEASALRTRSGKAMLAGLCAKRKASKSA